MEETGGASSTPVLDSYGDAIQPEIERVATLTSTNAATHVAQSLLNEHGGRSTGKGDDTPVAGDGLPTPCPTLAFSEHTDAAGDALPSALSEDEGTDDVGDDPAPVMGTLEDAQQFFDEGRSAIRSGDYEQAAELLSRALEIRALHHGELALECAFTYYKYGCALLYKAQSESDPLGIVKGAAEMKTGKNGKEEEEEGEDVEEEEESDLHMAWKMLDIARVIYEKQQSHSIEEIDVISALADVSLEREDFEMCFRDYTRALEILEGLVEPDNRAIAELCFKLSLAQQLGYKPKEALRYCQQAVSVCESRLRRLRNEVAIAKGLVNSKGKSPVCEDIPKDPELPKASPSPANSDVSLAAQGTPSLKQEDEIREIEQLLEDLREKVVELQDMASGPSLLESLQESNPGAVNSIKQVFSVAAQMVSSQEGSSGSEAHAEQSSGGFDAPSLTSTTVSVTHLGIVGRGVKRTVPVPVSNGLESTTIKKRSLDDMMTRGGAGDTQIGFGTSTGFGGSSS